MTGNVGRLSKAIRAFESKAAAGTGTAGLLHVEIRDDAEGNRAGLNRMFQAFGATIDDMPAVLEDAIPTIRAAHAAVFSTEGTAGRGQWEGLAMRTLEERAELGYGPGPILERSGALKAHVLSTPAVIRRYGTSVELRIRPDRSVGGVPKYDALARGYSPNNLPARPMVAVGPEWAAKISSQIQRSLRDRARLHGLG